MKKKIIMTSIFVFNCLIMFLPWFKGVDGNKDIYGTIMLENPIALTCLLFCVIGIWIHSSYGQFIEIIGWSGIITMQVYEFFTWHIRIMGGNISLQLSQSLTYSYFYYAVICAIMSLVIYKIFFLNEKKNQYENMLYI